MHVHKQQHLPVQTVFVYHLDCSCDISGLHTTVWKRLVQKTSCMTAEQPSLPKSAYLSGKLPGIWVQRNPFAILEPV